MYMAIFWGVEEGPSSKFKWFSSVDQFNMLLLLFSSQLDGLEKSFYSFYVCTAVRKFFFFLDPLRTGKKPTQVRETCLS